MNLFKSTKATTYISSRGDKVYPIIMDIKTGIVEGDAVFTTGDIDTAYLYTTILEEQSDYNILGSTVICNIQRPDGTTMKVQGDVLGNNLIEFPLGQSGVSQEGIYSFDIAVVFSEKKMVTSPTAQYSVTQSIEVIGEIEEDDRFPVLESLISGINVINEEELVRVSNEEVRQSKEEAREQAESVRARNEEVRLANNEAIRNEEAVRVTNENERKNAESLRVQEENKRKQQEATRVSQETNRVNEENVRKQQESTRQSSEATRVSQETSRSQAESTRKANETARQNQEVTRSNQEQTRVTAERNRVSQEEIRVNAESTRVFNEQGREVKEVERQNNESSREQQELTRVSQENTRKQNEQLRQQEHESRQQFLDGFEGKLNTVVDNMATVKDDVVAVKEANKRQDIFLQGLYNENLDGRVTVKEEGSVISLTNSDDGLVDVVGLEGNTMVNYVTGGAKELTLNGDIEAEGTNITLIEGADNGLVDVVCEGNTLVNEIKFRFKDTVSSPPYVRFTQIRGLKPNTTYTAITPYFDSTLVNMYVGYNGGSGIVTYQKNNIVKFTTGDTIISDEIWFYYRGTDSSSFVSTLPTTHVILEGDWTNKEIPVEYFEGMKSVGECEGNKIEILSQNKNFLINGFVSGNIDSNGVLFNQVSYLRSLDYEHCIPNTEIIASYNSLFRFSQFFFFDKDKIFIDRKTEIRATVPNNAKYFKLVLAKKDGTEVTSGDINSYANKTTMVRLSNQTDVYVEPKLNKKEISLNEPLRALPNGVKDKIVKIGGKWYVERNIGCKDLIVTQGTNWGASVAEGMLGFYGVLHMDNYSFDNPLVEIAENIICDKLPSISRQDLSTTLHDAIIRGTYYVGIVVKPDKLETQDFEGFKKYVNSLNAKFIYNLATPIYEELPIDPTINTYNDITHISNNSTIPCNMTVKNTGYNVIIKPSTQYTVAFDTNKSGTIGINLAGSKVTTTNNVATITTPSTLVDDTLRLTGKGIKASKVRLLEGDKTNWIPSYFEGMKSSFEDKLQDDGTYKMEILSYDTKLQNQLLNPNLKTYPFHRSIVEGDWNVFQWNIGDYFVSMRDIIDKDEVRYGDKIYVRFDVVKLSNANYTGKLWCSRSGGYNTTIFSGEFYNLLPLNQQQTLSTIVTHNVPDSDPRPFHLDFGDYQRNIECKFKIKDVTVVNLTRLYGEGNEPTAEWCDENMPYYNDNEIHYNNINKIQFSSIEPLRGVGDIKDRFVFKDGKLMIERNCKEITLNGTETWYDAVDTANPQNYTNTYRGQLVLLDSENYKPIIDRFSSISSGTSTLDYENAQITGKSLYLRINRKNLSTQSVLGLKNWLQANPVKMVYQLAESIYEEVPYETQKIILEGYENGTLFIDTNIPTTVTASYTANIPVVSELNKNSNEIGLTQEDLSVTQIAVDFLLMSNLGEEMLSSFNLNTRGRNGMGAYFANRIMKGALKYEDVISKYPQYKEEIDSILETK